MSETHAPQPLQERGGSPENCDGNADTGNDAGDVPARVLAQPDPARPVVEATLVTPAREHEQQNVRRRTFPKTPAPSRDNREAARKVRADRRKELLAIFFTGHTPGRLNAKRQRAYALLNGVRDPVEGERLRVLLANIWDAAQATSDEGL